MSLPRVVVTSATLGLLGLLVGVAHETFGQEPPPPAPEVVAPLPEAVDTGPEVRVVSHEVRKGESLGGILQSYGVGGVHDIVAETTPLVDLSRIKAGQSIELTFVDGVASALRYPVNEDETLEVSLGEPPVAQLVVKQYTSRTERVDLEIASSLWSAGVSRGLKPASILEISKVFENDVDFNTQLRPGARVVAVVEALYEGDRFVRYETLRALELTNSGKSWSALFYEGSEELTGWYDLDGKSLDRMAPPPPRGRSVATGFGPPFEQGRYKKYQTVTKSRPLPDGELQISGDFYQKRCSGRCKHSALDFRAAAGTPLVAIGDGVVNAITKPTSLCGSGVQLKMKDPTGEEWLALYCHMSKISVKIGDKVKRGKDIGLSGGTPGTYGAGHTTGAHLHLELRRKSESGRMMLVDPLPHIDWSPFTMKVRHTAGHEPKLAKAAKPVELPPPDILETEEATAFREQSALWLPLLKGRGAGALAGELDGEVVDGQEAG